MDEVFGSPKMQRQTLRVNQRRGIKQHFGYNTNLGYKSKAEPSPFTPYGIRSIKRVFHLKKFMTFLPSA